MKRFLASDAVAMIARLVLGLVFVIASADKLHDPAPFAASIANYRIMPPTAGLLVATVLPWIEVMCGLALIFGIALRGSSLLLASLLVVFTAAVISGLLRGLDISCGCFTQDPSASKIGWQKVGENTGLLLLAVLLFFSTSRRLTPFRGNDPV